MPKTIREATDADYIECGECSAHSEVRTHFPKHALDRIEPTGLPFGEKRKGWRCPRGHVIAEEP